MELKRGKNIGWRDLPKIESPFFACSQVKWAFFNHYGGDRVRGIDEMLRNDARGLLHTPRRDEQALKGLLEKIEHGQIFLVHGLGSEPFSPVVHWESEDQDQGRWVMTMSGGGLLAWSNLEWIVHRLLRDRGEGAAASSWWDQAVGGAKEMVNEMGRRTAASLSESVGLRHVEKATGREIGLATEGRDLLEAENEAQREGAQWMREHGYSAASAGLLMAAVTQGRSVLRDPKAFVADVKAALKHSRSESEALGKAGLAQAQRRLGHEADPRYTDRFHGPDGMTRKEGQLAEWEAKGARRDSRSVAKDNMKNRQGSSAKNARRAKQMTRDKARKIGQPSNRQGGPYTQEEIDLWWEVRLKKGNKQHISV
ncbi:MAG TPA: hypothetical protein ENI94_07370, partial [Gammaproteobacteria bacterium]|nr:hypothetical protein [Gammaproteobacteria bacterium]